MIRRLHAAAVVGIMSLGTISCGEDAGPEEPVPGELALNLIPDVSYGALLLRVTTESPRTVQYLHAHYGLTVYTRQVSDQEVRLILIGMIQPAEIALFAVSDVSDPEAYHATVTDASSMDGHLIPADCCRVFLNPSTGAIPPERGQGLMPTPSPVTLRGGEGVIER